MKKKMIALLAGALLTMAASNAMAAFAVGDLYRVVYNRAGSVEVATDLGSISSLLAGGAVTADTFSLSQVTGATSANDLYVAYYASTGSTGTAYVGTPSAPTTGSRKFSYFNTGYQNNQAYFQSLSPTATTVVASQSYINSYNSQMNTAGNIGTLAGYLPTAANSGNAIGDQNLATLLASGGKTTLYSIPGSAYVMTGTATNLVLATNFNTATGIGSTSLVPAATPTPIPAAAYLLGSGLLGLVGIRRKQK